MRNVDRAPEGEAIDLMADGAFTHWQSLELSPDDRQPARSARRGQGHNNTVKTKEINNG
jgi:hypothetical protein